MTVTESRPFASPDSPDTGHPKKLRVAFIGAGGIAGTHMTCLSEMEDVEVIGLADINEAGMREKAEKFGIPSEHLYTDYERMLAQLQPDAVDVCTPNGLHAPASIASSRAGAHVMVEKPMAMNADEARRMIDEADRAGRKLVVGFQYRYNPRTQFLKRQYDEGVFGEVMFGRVQALRRRGIPNWGVFGRKDLQGGGPLIDIGVHALEMCHYTMGSPRPVAVSGMTRTYLGDKPSQVVSRWPGWDHESYTVEDLAVGHIRFDNGAVIHLESSFCAHIEKGAMTFQLMGTQGGCTYDPPRVFHDQNGYMLDSEPGFLPPGEFRDNFRIKMRNFVDHLLHDTPTLAPAEDGLRVQQMIDGIYASADQGGKEVALKSSGSP